MARRIYDECLIPVDLLRLLDSAMYTTEQGYQIEEDAHM